MAYDRYPAVDEDFLFPPEVRGANGLAPEFRNQVVPLTQTQRNNLSGDDLWNGRLILNTTTNRIDRYDLAGAEWVPMTSEPAGVIKMYGGSTAPEFHVLANGGVYARDGIYAALFAVYGTQYNTGGELSTQFRVPNLKGKVPVGVDAGQAEFNVLGETGGEKTHTLTTAEMPSHDHTNETGGQSADHNHDSAGDGGHIHTVAMSDAAAVLNSGGTLVRKGGTGSENTSASGAHDHTISGASNDHSHNIAADGGGGAHNNLQPYIALNYIITL